MITRTQAKRPICIVGAAPDTSNLGVSALFASIVHGLHQRLPDTPLVVFDNGLGVRQVTHRVSRDVEVEVEHRGLRVGRRFDRPENLYSMAAFSRLGGLGSVVNSTLRCLRNCQAVLDISGGDSFSDIYGAERFWSIVLPKQIAVRLGVPLILMPQTYGPYNSPQLLAVASKVCASARQCWARDARSYKVLHGLLGSNVDVNRHFLGVDVAFGLEPVMPKIKWSQEQSKLLTDRQRPLIGLNISGLIFNHAESGKQYGFRANYRQVIRALVERIMADTDANLLLVPHVMTMNEDESDPLACQSVADNLPENWRSRIMVSPRDVDQCEVKWLIGQCHWFCGTRMHSTIASLSQGVPTATINYSDKALGVFESCEQGLEVFDPRKLDEQGILDGLMDSFRRRDAIREHLQRAIVKVKEQTVQQMDSIVHSFSPRDHAHAL